MVEVRYFDQRSNQLFQYCLARIIAERLGLELHASPIQGFKVTSEIVPGCSIQHPQQLLEGHRIDLASVLSDRTPRRIVLKGWFQRYEYFQPYSTTRVSLRGHVDSCS